MRRVQLTVLGTWGELPDDAGALLDAFAEAEWLERWRAGILADEIIKRLMGKG